jgi:hypothetical protein
MGIDDEMCDYLATNWMTRSTLAPRHVRVEPFRVLLLTILLL